ncbi:phage portal protein family protein [Sphingobium aromaticiconvertens]|uniref:phage portal protein family protein n=1 Tax=Sphingobium aromaticiconvertens TaxID=365341 RepID=UPI00301AF3B1
MARTPVPYRTAARTAGVARPSPELQQEIATTRDGRDITQPWVRGLREAKDPMLASAVDWGAYDRVFNDDQVYSTMQQRISAVVSRDWTVIAGDDQDPRSVKAADAFDRTLKRLPWDRITRKMLMATFYGYSVSELMWAPRDGLFDIVGIKVRHARRFRYDAENRLRMLTPTNMQGEILPERKFWVNAVGAADDDQPYGQGLAYWLYWPTLFKRNGIRFWNIFLDKFGTPTAKGTYPRGSQPAEINKLLLALQAIATDSGFVVPEGMAVELLSAAKSGTADFHQLCTYMDAAIAKIVLSQTMTTDNGSSRSQSETHAGVKLEVVKTDADDQTDSFTNGADGQGGPARWWTDWNFGTDVAAPIVRRTVEEEEDTQKTATIDKTLGDMGWVRTADSFNDTYGDGYVRRDDPDAPSGSMPAPTPPAIGKDGKPAIPINDNPADQPKSGKAPQVVSFAADDPRPLYVSRSLLNAGEVLDWMRSQGFTSTVPAEELHTTVAYSKRPVNWFAMGQFGSNTGECIVGPGGPRLVERLGDDGAVVLLFQSLDLQWRHREMRDAGASWDYPSYLPHITLTYDGGDIDLAKVQPYQGRLIFGPERFEAIETDWHEAIAEAPVASFAEADAHDDADGIVDRMIAEDGYRVANAMTGTLIDRLMSADSEIAARAILASAFGTMDEGPLIQALERAGFATQLDAANQSTNDGENNVQ